MPTYKKIDGVTVDEFTIDMTGTKPYTLKSTNAGLELLDDSNVRANILAANLPASNNQVQCLTIPLVFGDSPGTVSSTTTLPLNAVVSEVRVLVSTPFNLGVPNLDIGTVDNAALYADSTSFNLSVVDTVIVNTWVPQPNATAREVVATLTATGGNPTTGAATVIVFYVVQPLT